MWYFLVLIGNACVLDVDQYLLRNFWRYHTGNPKNRQHNGQKKKEKKDKKRDTKHTHKTKDRATRTPLKTWG